MAAIFRSICRRLQGLWIGVSMSLMTVCAVGGPGDIDMGFGDGGRVFINLDAYPEAAGPLAQQSDDKLLIGRGTNFTVATSVDLSVVRLSPDGSMDQGFGRAGMASTDLPGITASTRVVVLESSGKIIVAGPAWSDDNPNRVFAAVVRYLADGNLDPMFGSGGVLLEDFGAPTATIDTLVVLPDGRLVVTGYMQPSGGRRSMAFARYNPNGSIDATFGSGGRLFAGVEGRRGEDFAYALVQRSLVRRPDGRLIAVSTEYEASGMPRPVLLALTADGALDATFGTGGRVIADTASGYMSVPPQIGLQSDGKIVLAAIVERASQSTCELLISRLDDQGRLDSTFGNSGFNFIPVSSCTLPFDLIVGQGDRILIGAESTFDNPFGYGAWDYGSAQDFECPCNPEVLRLTSNGLPDSTFGMNGMATVDLGVRDTISNVSALAGTHLIQQADGSVVIATSGHFDDERSLNAGEVRRNSEIAVTRLRNSGASPGLIGFKGKTTLFSESLSRAVLQVQRTGGSMGTVSVHYSTSDGLAQGGPDYVPSVGTLTWADGDMADKTITIGIVDDSLVEGDETLNVTLSSPTGGSVLATSLRTIGIFSDDTGPAVASAAPAGSGGGGGSADWALILLLAMLYALGRRRVRRSGSSMRLFSSVPLTSRTGNDTTGFPSVRSHLALQAGHLRHC